jgi:hypothetical protein
MMGNTRQEFHSGKRMRNGVVFDTPYRCGLCCANIAHNLVGPHLGRSGIGPDVVCAESPILCDESSALCVVLFEAGLHVGQSRLV